MPQIIVTADGATDRGGSVMLRERINVADFESGRFAANLVERLDWAVRDAAEAEHETASGPGRYVPAPDEGGTLAELGPRRRADDRVPQAV